METKRIDNKADLNEALIEHYVCFQTERFFLGTFSPTLRLAIVCTSSMQDTCPKHLCKQIARYIEKISIANEWNIIYVGAWSFKVAEL